MSQPRHGSVCISHLSQGRGGVALTQLTTQSRLRTWPCCSPHPALTSHIRWCAGVSSRLLTFRECSYMFVVFVSLVICKGRRVGMNTKGLFIRIDLSPEHSHHLTGCEQKCRKHKKKKSSKAEGEKATVGCLDQIHVTIRQYGIWWCCGFF